MIEWLTSDHLAGPQSFAAGERQSIDMLFAHTTKLIQLQNYAGLQVVEHDVYETPLMAQRAQEVRLMLSSFLSPRVSLLAEV